MVEILLFNSPTSLTQPISQSFSLTETQENNYGAREGLVLTTENLDNDECVSIPTFYPLLDSIALEVDNQWYLHDSGLIEGGGETSQLDPVDILPCSNVPRTFLNEETCLLSLNQLHSLCVYC